MRDVPASDINFNMHSVYIFTRWIYNEYSAAPKTT